MRRQYPAEEEEATPCSGERALRKIVIGRKPWMFYDSDAHVEAAAAVFSQLASCWLHELDPLSYLE